MKALIVFLLILLGILQYKLWFSKNGVPEIFRLKQAVHQVEQKNTSLAKQNAVLMADIHDLQTGQEAIEERARNELGMVKKGETFYQIIQ